MYREITISLALIVKNEEDVLEKCIQSVKDAVDEIIVVDTGSTDSTKEIAERLGAKVFDFKWINDFSAARNFAFSNATMEYILWLDADDVFQEEDRAKLKAAKKTFDTTIDSLTMIYVLAKDSNGNVSSSLRRNRLVKRANNYKWIGAVHEYLEVWGKIVNSDICVTHSKIHHTPNRNIEIYESRLQKGEEFSPRDLYYFANELRDHRRDDEAAKYYKKFLATGKGWVEDNISSCGKLADIYSDSDDIDLKLKYIFKTFEYDTPRAEACCRLGYYFLNENKLNQAIFWYKLASSLIKPTNNMGFLNHSCWTWLPHLQLCVCYDRLGNYELSYTHNELASKYIPDDSRIAYNREYLEKKLQVVKPAE